MTHPGPNCSSAPEPNATDQRQKQFIRFSEHLHTAGTTIKDEVTQARKTVGKGQYGSGELFSILDSVSSIIQTMSGAVLGLDGGEAPNEVLAEQSLGVKDALVPGTSEWKLYFQNFSQRISAVGNEVQEAVMNVQVETGMENKEIFSILNNAADILHNVSSAMEKEIGDLAEEDLAEDTPVASPPTSKTSVKRSADNISELVEPRSKSVKMNEDDVSSSGGGDNNANTTTAADSTPASPASSTSVIFSRTAMRSSSTEIVVPPEAFMFPQEESEDESRGLSGSCAVLGHCLSYASDRPISLQLIGNRLQIRYQDPPSSAALGSSLPFHLSITEDNLSAVVGGINLKLRPKRGASTSEVILILNGEGQLELTLPE